MPRRRTLSPVDLLALLAHVAPLLDFAVRERQPVVRDGSVLRAAHRRARPGRCRAPGRPRLAAAAAARAALQPPCSQALHGPMGWRGNNDVCKACTELAASRPRRLTPCPRPRLPLTSPPAAILSDLYTASLSIHIAHALLCPPQSQRVPLDGGCLLAASRWASELVRAGSSRRGAAARVDHDGTRAPQGVPPEREVDEVVPAPAQLAGEQRAPPVRERHGVCGPGGVRRARLQPRTAPSLSAPLLRACGPPPHPGGW